MKVILLLISIQAFAAKYTLPKIPEVVSRAKDPKSVGLSKDIIEGQSKAFNELSLDKRRTYNEKFVRELYYSLMLEEPKDDDVLNWIHQLDEGASREAIYRQLILGSRYSLLESQKMLVGSEKVVFSTGILKNYLGTVISGDQLLMVNPFTLKRELLERTLEVVDEFRSRPDDLFVWYGLVSQHLAVAYPMLWNNKLRKISDVERHISWGKSVPFQHLKSELIIKLSKVYNSIE